MYPAHSVLSDFEQIIHLYDKSILTVAVQSCVKAALLVFSSFVHVHLHKIQHQPDSIQLLYSYL